MDCPELQELIDQIEGNVIPLRLKSEIENLLENNKACRAGYAKFLQIEQILQNTVYGEMDRDKHLAYLSHLAGRHLRYQRENEKIEEDKKPFKLSLVKILGFILVAAAVGTSAALVMALMNRNKPPVVVELSDSLAKEVHVINQDQVGRIPIPGVKEPPGNIQPESDGTVNPASILDKLNEMESEAISSEGAVKDSSRLKVLEAELSALQDAMSRSPGDRQLVSRMMDAYRKVIDQRRQLAMKERVRDYYNLGYLHYGAGEYPQAAIITDEGIKNVRIGPTEYLHYLKALSYYRMAERGSIPLPADLSESSEARVAGESMRASLDLEAKRKAVNDLRRAISEFTQLLNNPELESSATNWILKCNDMIRQIYDPLNSKDSVSINDQP